MTWSLSIDLVYFLSFNSLYLSTLKSLIEEHARLDFSDFLSTLLAIFHVINVKFPPARLLIYLVNKQAGWHFFQACSLFRSALLLGTSE